jgi:hypothetical protein
MRAIILMRLSRIQRVSEEQVGEVGLIGWRKMRGLQDSFEFR